MTRPQQIGVLVLGVLASLVALVSLATGVMALVDRGVFPALPALVVVPLVFGLIGWRAIAYAGPALARPEGPARANLASLDSFVDRARAGKRVSRER